MNHRNSVLLMVQFKNSKPVTEGDESVERKRDVLSDSKK